MEPAADQPEQFSEPDQQFMARDQARVRGLLDQALQAYLDASEVRARLTLRVDFAHRAELRHPLLVYKWVLGRGSRTPLPTGPRTWRSRWIGSTRQRRRRDSRRAPNKLISLIVVISAPVLAGAAGRRRTVLGAGRPAADGECLRGGGTRFQSLSSASSRRQEFLFKIIVVGDVSTGKTSLIQRFVRNAVTHQYKPTVSSCPPPAPLPAQVGVDFATKLVRYDDTLVRLQFWDTAGEWGARGGVWAEWTE